jgi:hypothetical protein
MNPTSSLACPVTTASVSSVERSIPTVVNHCHVAGSSLPPVLSTKSNVGPTRAPSVANLATQLPERLNRRALLAKTAVVAGAVAFARPAKAEPVTLTASFYFLFKALLAGATVVITAKALAREDAFQARTTPRRSDDPFDPGIEVRPDLRRSKPLNLPDGGIVSCGNGQLKPQHPNIRAYVPDDELSLPELQLCGDAAPYPSSVRRRPSITRRDEQAFAAEVARRAQTSLEGIRYVRTMRDVKGRRYLVVSYLTHDRKAEVLALYDDKFGSRAANGVPIPVKYYVADPWMLAGARDL